MTEETDTNDTEEEVESPGVPAEVPDEETDEIEQAVQQAEQYHNLLDEAKEWSNNQGISMRTQAELLEDLNEDSTEEEQMALFSLSDRILSVKRRIEQGDANVARGGQ